MTLGAQNNLLNKAMCIFGASLSFEHSPDFRGDVAYFCVRRAYFCCALLSLRCISFAFFFFKVIWIEIGIVFLYIRTQLYLTVTGLHSFLSVFCFISILRRFKTPVYNYKGTLGENSTMKKKPIRIWVFKDDSRKIFQIRHNKREKILKIDIWREILKYCCYALILFTVCKGLSYPCFDRA